MTEKHLIQEMLERFYAGNTTLEEDRHLRTLMEDPNLDASLHGDRELFRAMLYAAPPTDFMAGLEATIDNITSSDKSSGNHPHAHGRYLKVFVRLTAIAACAALIFTMAIPRSNEDTFAVTDELNGMTPQEIGANTVMALNMISRTINNGSRTASQVSSLFANITTEKSSQQ